MAAKKRKSATTKSACAAKGGRAVHFKGMKAGEVVCFGLKKKPRTKTTTKKACEASGGRPVHFKSMKKGEVACFAKRKKAKKTVRRARRTKR